MDIILWVGGRVVVNDAVDVVDMDPPCGHVRGHQRADLAGTEGGERPVALSLAPIAVNGRCRHT
jgi:hypothetical protein